MIRFNGGQHFNEPPHSYARRARSTPSPHEAFPTIIPPSQVPLPSKFALARPRRTLQFRLPRQETSPQSRCADDDLHLRGRPLTLNGSQYRSRQPEPTLPSSSSCKQDSRSSCSDQGSEVLTKSAPLEAKHRRVVDVRRRVWRPLWDLEDDERQVESQLLNHPPTQRAWSVLLSPHAGESSIIQDTINIDSTSVEPPELVIVPSSLQSYGLPQLSHTSEWSADCLAFPHIPPVTSARSRSLSPSHYSASSDSLAVSSSPTSSPSSSSASSSSLSLSSPSSIFTEPDTPPTGSTTIYHFSPVISVKPDNPDPHSFLPFDHEDEGDDVLHVRLHHRSPPKKISSDQQCLTESPSRVYFGSDPLTGGTQSDGISSLLLLPETSQPLNNTDSSPNPISFNCNAPSHNLSISSSPLSVLSNIFESIMGVSRVLVDSYGPSAVLAGSLSPPSNAFPFSGNFTRLVDSSLGMGVTQTGFSPTDIKPYGYRVGPKEVGMVFGEQDDGDAVTKTQFLTAPADEGDRELSFSSILDRVISFSASSYEVHTSNPSQDAGTNGSEPEGSSPSIKNRRLSSSGRGGSDRRSSSSASPPPTMVNLQRYPIIPYNPPPIRKESFPKVRDLHNGIWWCDLVPGGRDGRIDSEVLVSTEPPIPSMCRKTSRPPPPAAIRGRRRNSSSGRANHRRSHSRSLSPGSRDLLSSDNTDNSTADMRSRHRRSPSPSMNIPRRRSSGFTTCDEPITRGRGRTPRCSAPSGSSSSPGESAFKPSLTNSPTTLSKRLLRSSSFSRAASLDAESPSIYFLWAIKASMRYRGIDEDIISTVGAGLKGVRGVAGGDLESPVIGRRKRNSVGGGKSLKAAREGRECGWQGGVGIVVRSGLRFEITDDDDEVDYMDGYLGVHVTVDDY
ncbi:hypothetical protein FRC02_007826 [Tulasnella sp. 418]|nr:hypothetical protein FRC02_007826 [Tulasnella sp. 418]